MSKKTVCIVGTHQSGSTRIFNLVRLLFEYNGDSVHSCWNYNFMNSDEYDVIVSKVHRTEDKYLSNFDVVLLPLRNIIDAGISTQRRLPNKYIYQSCLLNIELFNKFKDLSHMVVRYEDYSIKQIRDISNLLGIEIGIVEIVNIMRELDAMHKSKDIIKDERKPDERYKRTLLSQSHNTSGGISNKFIYLRDNQIKYLFTYPEIVAFMEEHNYI